MMSIKYSTFRLQLMIQCMNEDKMGTDFLAQ